MKIIILTSCYPILFDKFFYTYSEKLISRTIQFRFLGRSLNSVMKRKAVFSFDKINASD